MKCKIPECSVTLASNSCSALKHNGVCRSCRGKGHSVFTQPRSTVDAALDKPPSIRNKAEWEALRDKYSGHIKCMLAQGESIQKYQAQYEQALQALAELPVQICPHELARLKQIEQEAHELADTLRLCGVPPKSPSSGERTLPYLNRMFRGRSFRGCFRGRH